MNNIETWFLNKNVKFKSQSDIWEYLSSNTDRHGVKDKNTGKIYTFRWYKTLSNTFASFTDYEPVEVSIWVNELLKGPLVCKVWNGTEKDSPNILDIIHKHIPQTPHPFKSFHYHWQNARPATLKEIKSLCWEELVL